MLHLPCATVVALDAADEHLSSFINLKITCIKFGRLNFPNFLLLLTVVFLFNFPRLVGPSPRSNHNLVLLRRMFTRIAMEKLVTRRNALLAQLKGELAAAEKLSERRASVSQATDRLEQLKELAGNFRQTQSKIEENMADPEAVQSVFNYREDFNESYYRAKDLLEQYIADLSPDDVQSVNSEGTVVDTCSDLKEAMKLLLETQRAMLAGHQGQVSGRLDAAGSSTGGQVSNGAPLLNVRLPPISVPVFNGERKNWRSFKDIFETTIHSRNDLKDSLKMQYLLSYLEGDAKRLISSFPISDANYREAWEALTNFFDKKKYTVKPLFTRATLARKKNFA